MSNLRNLWINRGYGDVIDVGGPGLPDAVIRWNDDSISMFELRTLMQACGDVSPLVLDSISTPPPPEAAPLVQLALMGAPEAVAHDVHAETAGQLGNFGALYGMRRKAKAPRYFPWQEEYLQSCRDREAAHADS